MKKNFFSEVPKVYTKVFSWIIVLVILIITYKEFPITNRATRDEPYYMSEVEYLGHVGLFKSMAQGTSIIYIGIIFILSKLLPIGLLTLMKLFSTTCYLVSCFLIQKLFRCFSKISYEVSFLGMVFFAHFSRMMLCLGHPDLFNTMLVLITLLFLLKHSYKSLIISAIILFISYLVKPVSIFYVPAIIFYIIINNEFKLKQKFINIILLVVVFSSLFLSTQMPALLSTGKIKLEDKDHTYLGNIRFDDSITWGERNIYFQVYNPNKRLNKFQITDEEVSQFRKNNPGKLELSYPQYVKQYFTLWSKSTAIKLFLNLPYYVDGSMFYHKWSVINKWVKNLILIEFISLIIFVFFYFKEKDFIFKTSFYVIPFIYYFLISLYALAQSEYNWYYSCMPFFAIPIYRFLERQINIYILLFLQLLMLFI